MRKINNIFFMMKKQGFVYSVLYYIERFIDILYGYIIFSRRIDIKHDSCIIGKKYISLGSHFVAGKSLWIEAVVTYGNVHKQIFYPKIIIGDNVSLGDFVHIGCVNKIEIGNNVLFGSKVYVTDHNHGIYSGDAVLQSNPEEPPAQRMLSYNEKVIIEDNVWIGDNVTVLPGVTIGRGSIVAANAVVSKDIPPYSIAAGVPTKVIKKWNSRFHMWETV